MPIGTTGQIVKVILIVLLIILLVIQFFTLFVGLAFIILPGLNNSLVHYGLFMVIVAGLLICLSFVGLCGAVRECYLKLFVFAGLLIAVLLVSLLVHLFMLPNSTRIPRNLNERGVGDRIMRKRAISEDILGDFMKYEKKNSHVISRKRDVGGEKETSPPRPPPPEVTSTSSATGTPPPAGGNPPPAGGNPPPAGGSPPPAGGPLPPAGGRPPGGDGGTIPPTDYYDDYKDDDYVERKKSKITMVAIIRTVGYFIQLAAVVLAIWLGTLILLSYHYGYY